VIARVNSQKRKRETPKIHKYINIKENRGRVNETKGRLALSLNLMMYKKKFSLAK
jgi:hypothetical protein